MTELEKKIGYEFKTPELLEAALTHSSFANENRRSGVESNERLEFLGDSILGMVVAEHLFKNCPDMPEGKMTKFRAELVCERSLAAVAERINLGASLLLGKGEAHCGGRNRASILADATEAVLAAIYLDGGMEAVKRIISGLLLSEAAGATVPIRDYKTTLQEAVQKKSGQVIKYELVGESGPDHSKTFQVRVCVNGQEIGCGSGRSKKEAEQMAAKRGLEAMNI